MTVFNSRHKIFNIFSSCLKAKLMPKNISYLCTTTVLKIGIDFQFRDNYFKKRKQNST